MRLPGGELLELLGDAVPRDHSRQQLADAFVPRVLAADGPAPDVLDLGCGEGGSVELFRSVRADVRWIGLDLPDSPYAPRPGADVRTYDGETMPFGDASFDVVFSKQVLEHVHDPRRVLAEVRRVLRPGGRFAGSTSQMEPFHARSTFAYTPYGLALLLRDAGLALLEVRPGIDVGTLVARRAARGAGVFARWWDRDSPGNRAIELAGRLARADAAHVNAAKLAFCGQFSFLSARLP